MNRAERAYRFLTRGFIFVVILMLLLAGISSFLQPVWFYENNYHTYRSFYDEPHNTVETIFVGASMTLFGFSPMEMYEQDGICAYNLASTSQPMMMSYFWIKEAERLQGQTMDTVVLDVSMLRRTSNEEDYRKALDGLDKNSPVRREAIEALSDGPLDYLSYQLPILGYHDRWSSIDYTDFVKYEDNLEDYARGYFMEFHRIFSDYSVEQIPIPTVVYNANAKAPSFETESLFYFNKIQEFCKEKGIRLVLVKTPSPQNWSSGEHNGVQALADSFGLEFLDYDIEPLLSQIGYNAALDSKDNRKHLNYYGAMKLSHAMSTYLSETCGNRDVRGDKKYAYLGDQLERYHNKISQMADATLAVDPADYLEKVTTSDNYTVLITVRDDAAKALTAEQRLVFSKLGLKQLSSIQPYDSYIAIVNNGTVELEQLERKPDRFDEDVEHYLAQREELAAAEEKRAEEEAELEEGVPDEPPVEDGDAPVADDEQPAIDLDAIEEGEWHNDDEELAPITYDGSLSDGTHVSLTSGGYYHGNTCSCMVYDYKLTTDVEQCSSTHGLQIIVYDNDSHRVVDKAYFETGDVATREDPDIQRRLDEALASGMTYSKLDDQLKQLYRYNRRVRYAVEAESLKQELGPTGMYYYLQHFSRKNILILIAVKDDATNALSWDAREAFGNMGLVLLRDLEHHAPYCAAIEDGRVKSERTGLREEELQLRRKWYTITSAGWYSNNLASIVIDDNGYSADYAPNSRGFNIVVYNPKLDILVDKTAFDTWLYDVDVPQPAETAEPEVVQEVVETYGY